MPNWTPSEDHINRLQQTVNHLTNRRATMMEEDYPLNHHQVVAITSPPRLREFIDLGYDSLRQTHHISYELGPDQGLGRRSITSIQLTLPIHYAFQRQLRGSYQEDDRIYFNPKGIDAELMGKLKAWTEKAVYERRLAAMVNTTVVEFFQHMTTGKLTMYHIMARWPGLKVVFGSTSNSYYRGADIWERHSNEVPRNLQRWGWPQFGLEAEWRIKYMKRLQITEETLLSCVSLSEPKNERRYRLMVAQVTDWQKLGGMPF